MTSKCSTACMNLYHLEIKFIYAFIKVHYCNHTRSPTTNLHLESAQSNPLHKFRPITVKWVAPYWGNHEFKSKPEAS